MKRGIGMGYAIILSAYLTVSVTGEHIGLWQSRSLNKRVLLHGAL